MNAMSRRFYDQLLQQLQQRSIRGNRYKLALYRPFTIDPSVEIEAQLTQDDTEQTVFAFTIMFERNNTTSAWRLVTPLKWMD